MLPSQSNRIHLDALAGCLWPCRLEQATRIRRAGYPAKAFVFVLHFSKVLEMAKSPAFQFYPDEWLSSPTISMMSPAEEGAYIRLLCFAWGDPDCTIPDDDEQLARLSRLGEGWLNGPSTILRRVFIPHPKKPGKLFNPRLLDERKKQADFRRKCSDAGRRSGNSRRTKSLSAERTLNEPSTNVEPNTNSLSLSLSLSSKEEKETTSSNELVGKKSESVSAKAPETATPRARISNLCDDDFLNELQSREAYKEISVRMAYARCLTWCEVNNRQPTRRMFVNWLNREKPLSVKGNPHGEYARHSNPNVRESIPQAGRTLKGGERF